MAVALGEDRGAIFVKEAAHISCAVRPSGASRD
jgi:hypothetical protein